MFVVEDFRNAFATFCVAVGVFVRNWSDATNCPARIDWRVPSLSLPRPSVWNSLDRLSAWYLPLGVGSF